MMLAQKYWFIKLLVDSVLSVIINDIGTADKMDSNKPNMEPLIALYNDLLSQATGTKAMNVINQPAPKGKGKYSVQNEFGTVIENRNWLGEAMIASPKRAPLPTISNVSRRMGFSMYG